MTEQRGSFRSLIEDLQERAKELNCLYRVEEALRDPETPLDEVCQRIADTLPPGWQYPTVCHARVRIGDRVYESSGYEQGPAVQHADIRAQDELVGRIEVTYTETMPPAHDGPFLAEEAKLIQTIADRVGHFIVYQRMRHVAQGVESAARGTEAVGGGAPWQLVVSMLKQTDPNLHRSVSRKLLNHLCWSGLPEAEALLPSFPRARRGVHEGDARGENEPLERHGTELTASTAAAVFDIAAHHLPADEILQLVQKWVQEDKLSFLIRAVHRRAPFGQLADAIRRYHHLVGADPTMATTSAADGVSVALIRRLLNDDSSYLTAAKRFIRALDFYDLLEHIVSSTDSQGKLGGKASGLLLASHILKKAGAEHEGLAQVHVPKTWFVASDVLLDFIHYNDLDEVVELQYRDPSEIRREYPHLVQAFKSGTFPYEITRGLAAVLDEVGNDPLIVRSSSLLEDRAGAAFSGKYKSLFLANQGDKRQRLHALMDAIAEVYASTFNPDAIEYRSERGLLDYDEEMAVLIQRVVGTRVGRYFLPTYAGVAFSHNEFRWSPRIERDDGLVRLVPGLGTRAVDRLVNDYPVLAAPGQPGLRVNVTTEETVRYAPRRIDLIDLENNRFETVAVDEFFREAGAALPGYRDVISLLADGELRPVPALRGMEGEGTHVATFDRLIGRTPFLTLVRDMLTTLEEALGGPVDIEFAHDGHHFHLLQCRPQSYAGQDRPAPIPHDVDEQRVVFAAKRHVSNGVVDQITHVVYVDPDHYGRLGRREDMLEVGAAVGRLNKVLPKRQFILIGPGRWGSRGDIKLGVSVTYGDISNTSMLVEVARGQAGYAPDLSFGTHFFQDLVESKIRYLPLYPDEDGTSFNHRFLTGSPNLLAEVVPEAAHLADTIRLIDVPASTSGQVLRVLMNAELDEALAVLTHPQASTDEDGWQAPAPGGERAADYWRWRLDMAERIAAEIDPVRFGVVACYVFGSTKNATAGPGSDIDLLVHVRNSAEQQAALESWLEGWSLCLDELNYLRTGYRAHGLLDVHFVTDEDIERRSSFAVKIGAVTDAARPLALPGAESA